VFGCGINDLIGRIGGLTVESVGDFLKNKKVSPGMHGYDEDGAVIFILMNTIFFTVQLDSTQFSNLGQINFITSFVCHPYRNFQVIPDLHIAGKNHYF
jgi:hypothetical protein